MRRWSRLRQWRPSRLGLKLFVVILSVNVAIAASVFLAVSYSIDRGFLEYLNQAQERRATLLADGLITRWETQGDWAWLEASPERWPYIVRFELGQEHRDRPSPLGEAQDFALRDSDGEYVIPPTDTPRGSIGWRWLMLYSDMTPSGQREAIGALGFRPPQEMMERMESRFLERQQRNLVLIVISLGLASLLLAGGLSWWLGRRTRALAGATLRLTEGDYHTRLPERGRDELSRLARDFNVLAATLEASREARARWVSDTAHELRTPLAVLRGEIEAMQDGIRPLNQENLGSLAQEVAQLERLVADLRLLSQSDAGALDIQLAPMNLSESLESRLNDADRWLEESGLSLSTDLAPDVMIRGDAQRLRQLWNNLLDNSCAYTQPPGQLSVALTCERDHAVITWQDSAPGVPPEELSRLTERLYRVEGSRNRASGGSGLGLSIASALVAAHGGTLTPSASPLGGLTWILRLPLLSAS
ncbi:MULTISPECIES: ATP-binding protein [unclassified Halomonas]|jgi:two-component system sensor histidine kinase BaeS|uniref:ATP-binding protein n=1 Tax=unclassified Halomonas TaxID=2609666 RepID=UPI001EF548BC|nr:MULTISPECIES: ATP-binding protein [unclassified Halomonas]MCG7590161.1 ATP-binding protein [Halomonas sp. McD50-5]MCG7615790.1 ATP-binding protein [Halomonas sp. McD50-4]BCB59666.1 two-component sensor histidine kinase [Halomonas sp. A020]